MNQKELSTIQGRVDRIRQLTGEENGIAEYYEAVSIAQSVVHDTVGGSHPVMHALEKSLSDKDWSKAIGASRAVITLYEQGSLKSPRLSIAAEIETDLLVTAQTQAQAAEKNTDQDSKTIQIAIAAFLTGSALEDALRRLCDANQLPYDVSNSSISKLQSALYQPSNQIEVISSSDNKQITAWGDTRNKATHGKFKELTLTEVVTMIMGAQSFIDRHLA